MLARAPRAVFPGLNPQTYQNHALHQGERDWPETNCYVDLWIELLHATGRDPTAALGFTVAQDFEGDQFTFFKFPPEDLELLYGTRVQELSIFDTLEAHALEQIERGRMVLIEVDGYFLPDTRGTSYQTEHTKTTIALNRLDPAARRMDYFHNAGFYTLQGADYDGVLRTVPGLADRSDLLFPYVEFVKFDQASPADLKAAAAALLRKHLGERPPSNPIAAFRARVGEQAFAVSQRDPAYFHKYAFSTLRQLGANFELLGSHVAWLAHGDEAEITKACAAISAGAKAFQFQLARAVARKRFDGLGALLDPLVDHYDRAQELLSKRFLG